MKNLQDFPRIPLAVLPTPIQKLENISRLLNTNVYIKRDDLTGIGLGGNKVRKLEFLLADAKRQGAEVVFTTGGAQSNHAMLTAACAKKLGMTPILILKKRGVTDRKGNQLLEYLMDTDVRFMDTDSYDDIYAEMDRVGRELGRPYYKIPCGGSDAIGALGYVNCMKEIADTGMRFDYVCCAEGSGGTHAGVALGAMLYMPQTKTVGLMVDSDPFDVITTRIMQEAARLLELDFVPTTEDVHLVNMCGPGYAIPSAEGNAAIRMMAIWGVIAMFRRVMEPKFVGDQTGLSPILSLVSIYVGMRLAGVWGMILAPILVLVCQNLAQIGLFSGVHRDLNAAADDIAAILSGAKDEP